MIKKDLIIGEHWVETKSGNIGVVVKDGVVFGREISYNMDYYNNNLQNTVDDSFTIIRILKPKMDGVLRLNLKDIERHAETLSEINNLIPITSLDQLEEVRKELEDEYNKKFYLSNESGKWEIMFNALEHQTSCVDSSNGRFGYTRGLKEIGIRAVDLEKEGYQLRLGE
jgi:hypothetical protein